MLWGVSLWRYNTTMRFQVPQFIEVEDKLFGPLTARQFVYLAGGVGLSIVLYRFIHPFFLAVPFILIIMIFSIALAFYKINDRFPFIYMVESAFKYFVNSKLYIWRKEEKKIIPQDQEIEALKQTITVPKLSQSKLKDLTWSLDINNSVYANKKDL